MQEGGDVKVGLCGKKPAILPYGLKPPERASTLMRARRTAGMDSTNADGATKREPLSLQETPILWAVSPLRGKTTDRRAGCGRTASPVRREGASKPIDAPYPYQRLLYGDPCGRRTPLSKGLFWLPFQHPASLEKPSTSLI